MGPIAKAVYDNIKLWERVDKIPPLGPVPAMELFVDDWRLKMDLDSKLYQGLLNNIKRGER